MIKEFVDGIKNIVTGTALGTVTFTLIFVFLGGISQLVCNIRNMLFAEEGYEYYSPMWDIVMADFKFFVVGMIAMSFILTVAILIASRNDDNSTEAE